MGSNGEKRLFVACVLGAGLLVGAGQLEGQEPGMKFGLVRAQADISRRISGITWGPIHEGSVGLYFSLDVLGGQWGIQPEVNFSTKGFEAREIDQGESVSSQYKISYIEVPLLVSWSPPLKGHIRPGLFCGPYFGFARRVTEVQTAFQVTANRELGDNLKGGDFGIVFGGNVRCGLGSAVLRLDVRYSQGLNNLSKDIGAVAYEFQEGDKIKNGALAIALGVGFNFKVKPDP